MSQRHSGAGFGDSDRCFSVDDAIENVGLAIDELTVDDEATPAALALACRIRSCQSRKRVFIPFTSLATFFTSCLSALDAPSSDCSRMRGE